MSVEIPDRDPLADTDPNVEIPGLKEALAEGAVPVIVIEEVAGTATIRGRAVVPHSAEPALVMSDDTERHRGGAGMFRIATGLGLAAALLVIGAGGGIYLVTRDRGTNAAPGQAPGTGPVATAELTPSATPTPTPTPSPKVTPSPAKSTAPENTTQAPTATTTSPAGPNYNGKIIVGSNGESYYVDSSGTRHHIANAAVSACISVRRGAGSPVSVADGVVGGMPGGAEAYCPYEINGSGTINFVTEAGSGGLVWLVVGGTKHHVGGLCPPQFQGYPYEVHQVPAGETAGHQVGSDWFGDDQTCGALPR